MDRFGQHGIIDYVSCEELLMKSNEGHVIIYNNSVIQQFKKLPIEGKVTQGKSNWFESYYFHSEFNVYRRRK